LSFHGACPPLRSRAGGAAMAAASSDQENGLLQGEAPPAGRLPIKVPLALGLCVFAAGLAGAVMMEKPAARAPTTVKHPWGAISLQHVSQDCLDLHHEIFQDAQKSGRVIQIAEGEGLPPAEGPLDCKEESEQVCTATVTTDCSAFPSDQPCIKTPTVLKVCTPDICKEENIVKEYEDMFSGPYTSGVDVSCVASVEEMEEDEADTKPQTGKGRRM